jgi:hypothetical protein
LVIASTEIQVSSFESALNLALEIIATYYDKTFTSDAFILSMCMPFSFLASPAVAADAAVSNLTWCSSSSFKDEEGIFYTILG